MRRMSRLEKAIVQEMERIKHKASHSHIAIKNLNTKNQISKSKKAKFDKNHSLWDHQTIRSRIQRNRNKFHNTYEIKKSLKQPLSRRTSMQSSRVSLSSKIHSVANFQNFESNGLIQKRKKKKNSVLNRSVKSSLNTSQNLQFDRKTLNRKQFSSKNSLCQSRELNFAPRKKKSLKESLGLRVSRTSSQDLQMLRSSSTRSLMKENLGSIIQNIQNSRNRAQATYKNLAGAKQLRNSKNYYSCKSRNVSLNKANKENVKQSVVISFEGSFCGETKDGNSSPDNLIKPDQPLSEFKNFNNFFMARKAPKKVLKAKQNVSRPKKPKQRLNNFISGLKLQTETVSAAGNRILKQRRTSNYRNSILNR